MKLVMRPMRLAALSLALATAPLAPALAQALSPSVGNPLKQASAAARAGNNAAAVNYVNQARAAASTPTERTKVAQMAAYVYTAGGNYARAAAELESLGAPASQLAPLYYRARQYDKAIEAGRRSGQTTIVAQSYLMQGKPAEAAKIYQEMVARNPNNTTALQNLAGAQFKAGDRKAYLATVQKLVRLDPTPARWQALLTDVKGSPMPRDAKLALYHLMRETGTLTKPGDIQDFAKIAIVGGQPGVAADVARTLPAGDPMAARLVDAAAKRQQAALAQAPAQARAADTAFAAGNTYLGANQLPQAVAAYSNALKGPAADEAVLFKGIAEMRAGNTAAARSTFARIPAGPYADIGALWSLYASTKA